MSEKLLSVGLDVGTTTTQLIVSELTVQNEASSFAVPQMQITSRKIRYQSPVYFTPLVGQELVDGAAVRKIVTAEYEKAGISRETVDTGAIIITGETSRKENAQAVLSALSDLAGEFVVATAGPDLESVLAAKGAGAVDYSQATGKTLLHIDIGGGTSNMALICEGVIVQTGCLNVGGRLIKQRKDGRIEYVSPVLSGLTDLRQGDYPEPVQVEAVAQILVHALEMAAGLRTPTSLLEKLTTRQTITKWRVPTKDVVISFSGGVADCIESAHEPNAFGDIGPILGQAIAKSRLCQGAYMLGKQTIRATVIGAGCHSAQLSGSTVFSSGVALPVKNLPVAVFTKQEQDSSQLPELIAQRIRQKDADKVVLALPGDESPTYEKIDKLASAIAQGVSNGGVYICLQADMAKALGHKLRLKLPQNTPILCIDSVQLHDECFLDVGAAVGPAMPVVVKTLILSQ